MHAYSISSASGTLGVIISEFPLCLGIRLQVSGCHINVPVRAQHLKFVTNPTHLHKYCPSTMTKVLTRISRMGCLENSELTAIGSKVLWGQLSYCRLFQPNQPTDGWCHQIIAIFFFWWYRGLNSVPWATLPALFLWFFFFEIGSRKLFAQAGFEPCFSWSLPLISASWISRITGVSHWCPALHIFLSYTEFR
jgi:hypothetical protein